METREVAPCLLLIAGSALTGLIDDVCDSHCSKGFISHVRTSVKERQITTGMLKAAGIFFLAIVSVFLSADAKPLPALIFDATLISLFANFMNLLDLQPARSGKAFLITLVLLLMNDRNSCAALVPVGLGAAVLAGLSDELREKYMMGDTGSNPLGAALGYWIALDSPRIVKVLVLLFLTGVHIHSEQHSLSKTIDRNLVLRFIDRLGRS